MNRGHKKKPYPALFWNARKFTQYALLVDSGGNAVAFGHKSKMEEAYMEADEEEVGEQLVYIGDGRGTDRDTIEKGIMEVLANATIFTIEELCGQGRRRRRWIEKKGFFAISDLEKDLSYRQGVRKPRTRKHSSERSEQEGGQESEQEGGQVMKLLGGEENEQPN